MKAYFGKEAREYQEINPKGFEKSFNYYLRSLQSRIKTFEKHGKTKSKSVKRLREVLYDVQNAYTNEERASAFSRASFALTSARGSYTKSRKIDIKIVKALNEEFSTRDPDTGKIIEKFITLEELEDFGEMMEELKDSALSNIYGSDQISRAVREVLNNNKGEKPLDWRSAVEDYLGRNK